MGLFRRAEATPAARAERQDEAERRLTDALRALSARLLDVAEALERRRLMRRGYEAQDTYLERDSGEPPR